MERNGRESSSNDTEKKCEDKIYKDEEKMMMKKVHIVVRSAAVSLVWNFCVAEQPISDYKAITFNLTLSKPPYKHKTVISWALKNLDVEAFTGAVNLGGLLDDNLCLASAISRYEHVLEDTLNQMAPIRSRLVTIRNNAPWYSEEIAIAKRLRRKLERKWRQTRLEYDRLEYIQQCGIILALAGQFKKLSHKPEKFR